MGFLDVLGWRGGGESATLYECRDCGVKVSPDASECPVCGSTEIARYRF